MTELLKKLADMTEQRYMQGKMHKKGGREGEKSRRSDHAAR